MITLRRASLILLAGVLLAIGFMPLDRTSWAEQMNGRDQARQIARLEFRRSHKQDMRPLAPPETRLHRYTKGVVGVVGLEMGLPCAATLGLLAYTRRRRAGRRELSKK